jgi:heme-degrading monooxygenase HmoA
MWHLLALGAAMFVYVWEYEVRPEHREAFLTNYSTDGTWVALFRKAPGYLRTKLLEDRADASRFVTIDSWETAEHHESFRREFASELQRLDLHCETLTSSESLIGHFDTASPGDPD